MFYYKINKGRYVAELDFAPADCLNQQEWYESLTRIDCTQYMPDGTGNPVPIPAPEPVVVVPPTPYVPSAAEIQAGLVQAVQSHLDSNARSRNYDNITTAVTYAGDTTVTQFGTEGAAYKEWRSLVWAKCYEILGAVQAGTRAVPTAAELIAELPAFGLDTVIVWGNDSMTMGNDSF